MCILVKVRSSDNLVRYTILTSAGQCTRPGFILRRDAQGKAACWIESVHPCQDIDSAIRYASQNGIVLDQWRCINQ